MIYIFYITFLIGIFIFFKGIFPKAKYKVECCVSKDKNYNIKNIFNNINKKVSEFIYLHIKINNYQEDNLNKMLSISNDNRTPKQFVSDIIATSVLIAVVAIMFLPIYSTLSICLFALSFCYSWNEFSNLKNKYVAYKQQIELELPKLCSVIASRLKSTTVVENILKGFMPISNEEMKNELAKTLKDISMSSTEEALKRFEGRISSNKLSEVIRGLIAVSRGDNQEVYFKTKQYEFNNDYKVIKRRDIQMRSFKLAPAFFILFVLFILTIVYPMALILQNQNF